MMEKAFFSPVYIMLINDIILNFLGKLQTLVTKFEYRLVAKNIEETLISLTAASQCWSLGKEGEEIIRTTLRLMGKRRIKISSLVLCTLKKSHSICRFL